MFFVTFRTLPRFHICSVARHEDLETPLTMRCKSCDHLLDKHLLGFIAAEHDTEAHLACDLPDWLQVSCLCVEEKER